MTLPWRAWSAVLRERHGGPVRKLALDTGAGCPHRNDLASGGCLYCDERGGGDGAALLGLSLPEQVRQKARSLKRRFPSPRVFLYFQSYSCTQDPPEILEAKVRQARETAREEGLSVLGLAFGVRPDQIPAPFLETATRWGDEGLEVWIEVGVQTLEEDQLVWLRRGHGAGAAEDAARTLRGRGLFLCAHLIGGIPGDDPERLARDASTLARWGFHALKLHPLHVLRGAALEDLYRRGLFTPVPEEVYRDQVVRALATLPETTILQRLTADAPPDRLIAPAWMGDKAGTLRRLQEALETQGLRQGCRLPPQP